MATAARCTIAQVDEIVELGELDPESIVTPGIFVQRVVQVKPRRRKAGRGRNRLSGARRCKGHPRTLSER